MKQADKLEKFLGELTKLYRLLGLETTIKCSCGFRTDGISLQQLNDHLVSAHGFSRKTLDKSLNKVLKDARNYDETLVREET